MKKVISLILVFTLVFSSIALVGCQGNFNERITEKLDNTYLLDTPLSRFFVDDGKWKKTLNSMLEVWIYGEDYSLDVDFFGKNIVKSIDNIESFTWTCRNPSNAGEQVRCTAYTVSLYTNNKLSLLSAAYKLSKLPGVFTVDVYVMGDDLLSSSQ